MQFRGGQHFGVLPVLQQSSVPESFLSSLAQARGPLGWGLPVVLFFHVAPWMTDEKQQDGYLVCRFPLAEDGSLQGDTNTGLARRVEWSV